MRDPGRPSTFTPSAECAPNVAAIDLPQADWRKSSFSSVNGDCVEVAQLDQAVAVRDSKNPGGPVLVCTPGEWGAFIRGVANGEFHG